MKIVLIGYRGTGKSAVARRVAKRLRLGYACMDEIIVDRANMSINQIVATHGWSTFRDLETEVAKGLAPQDGVVVDTGGGIIERTENMTLLAPNAVVIWLKASVDSIVARIEKDAHRPALTSGKTFTEEVEEVLSRRVDRYRSAAHREIDTDQLTVDQTADRVVAIWEEIRKRRK